MFNPAILKPAVGLAVSFCASRQIGLMVRANSPAAVTTFQKVALTVGAYGLGSAAGNFASAAVLNDIEQVEELVENYKKAQKNQA